MGYPDNVLAGDEQVVLHRHPHWKRLVGPVLLLIITTVVAAFVAAVVDKQNWGTAKTVVQLVILARMAFGRRLADRVAVPELADNAFRDHRPQGDVPARAAHPSGH